MLYHSRFELLTDDFIFDNYLEFKNFLKENYFFNESEEVSVSSP